MRRASAFRLPLKCDSSPQACLTTSSFAEAIEVRLSLVLREKAVCVRMLVHGISRTFLPANTHFRPNSHGIHTYAIREANSFKIRTCEKIPRGGVYLVFAKCIARRGAQAAFTTPSRSTHFAPKKRMSRVVRPARPSPAESTLAQKRGWGVPPFPAARILVFSLSGSARLESGSPQTCGVLSTRGRVRSATPKKDRALGSRSG